MTTTLPFSLKQSLERFWPLFSVLSPVFRDIAFQSRRLEPWACVVSTLWSRRRLRRVRFRLLSGDNNAIQFGEAGRQLQFRRFLLCGSSELTTYNFGEDHITGFKAFVHFYSILVGSSNIFFSEQSSVEIFNNEVMKFLIPLGALTSTAC